MIPRVGGHSNRFKLHGDGQSFKGAGLYYLHDKNKASTSQRVAFTHTLNLPTDDPDKALRFMAHTAMRAEDLKTQAGVAKTGRKLQKSVYTYSLSWHPEEKVTPAEMIEAARETMKILKIEDREALLVAHNDELYPHIHIIVNRVSPDNGIAAPLRNDWNKLSRWAQRYEKKRGKLYCEQRVANNDRRAKGEYVKYRPAIDTAEYRRWKQAQNEELQAHGRALEINVPEHHRVQRRALYTATERRILQRRQQIREKARPEWRLLLQQQNTEALGLERTRRNVFKRLLYWVSHRQDIKARGGLVGAFHALLGYHDAEFLDAMNMRHLEDRKALARRINDQIRGTIMQESEQFRINLAALKQDQAAERDAAAEHEHAKEWEEDAREDRSAGDASDEEIPAIDAEYKRDRAGERPVRDEFRARAAKRTRKPKRRDKAGRSEDAARECDD